MTHTKPRRTRSTRYLGALRNVTQEITRVLHTSNFELRTSNFPKSLSALPKSYWMQSVTLAPEITPAAKASPTPQ